MPRQTLPDDEVNNEVYESLGNRWYMAKDDPIALLRAEARFRNEWINQEITRQLGPSPAKIIDIGCGGGFLSNYLTLKGHEVVGVDISKESLKVAARFDTTGKASYISADALDLPFSKSSFDVACALDILEHVQPAEKLIAEASRVLRPGGIFFFHTFNRSLQSWLLVIKFVPWFVRNTPRNLHLFRYFIRPSELAKMLEENNLLPGPINGVRPKILPEPILEFLLHGTINEKFQFKFSRSLAVGYLGWAQKVFH